MSRIQPVILAGGSGTRLWPASRAHYPKQLLPIASSRTMLQDTALRLDGSGLSVAEPMIICNEAHRFLVGEQLRAVDRKATIVLEPAGRNTAPAAALAALAAIDDSHGDDAAPLLLIMPADHVIEDAGAFAAAVETGVSEAARGKLVCFGIVPTFPATGYGYIESTSADGAVAEIASFVEKPDETTAVGLLQTQRHFWNAGIFLMRADCWMEELNRFAPDMCVAVAKALDEGSSDGDFIRPDADAFRACPSDSIDYAVMEHTDRGMMVPLDAGWSDLGSWSAVHDVSESDDGGNSMSGDVLAIDCKNSFFRSQSRLVAAVGVEDLIVVEDQDTVLVTRLQHSQGVKKLVDELNRRDRRETQHHRREYRSWGSIETIDSGDGFDVKQLVVRPGGSLRLQKHPQRSLHWFCLSGVATVHHIDEVVSLQANESRLIAAGDAHSLTNNGAEDLLVLEIRRGDCRDDELVEYLSDA